MGTTIRPEVSKKRSYWMNKDRYYELKHFCLQYPKWKEIYNGLEGFSRAPADSEMCRSTRLSDPTARCAAVREEYGAKMRMVEESAKLADEVLWSYILKAVTEGISYEHLKSRLEIPCGKDMFYDRYRKFFWILSNARN